MYVVGIDTKRLLFDRALRQEFSWMEGYLFQPYVGRAGDRDDWRRLVVRYYRLSGFLEGFLYVLSGSAYMVIRCDVRG
jgi:hypothetical protein